jgi:hypothetical protein
VCRQVLSSQEGSSAARIHRKHPSSGHHQVLLGLLWALWDVTVLRWGLLRTGVARGVIGLWGNLKGVMFWEQNILRIWSKHLLLVLSSRTLDPRRYHWYTLCCLSRCYGLTQRCHLQSQYCGHIGSDWALASLFSCEWEDRTCLYTVSDWILIVLSVTPKLEASRFFEMWTTELIYTCDSCKSFGQH